MITWWKEILEESCVQEGRCEARRRCEGKKNKWGENFFELARPLTRAYVCLCGQSAGISRIKCGHQTTISNINGHICEQVKSACDPAGTEPLAGSPSLERRQEN